MADYTFLICGLVTLGAPAIPGSVRDSCVDCERSIWIAPTGQQLKATGAIPVCVGCGLERMRNDSDLRINPPTEEQRQEIRHAIGGDSWTI